MCLQTTAQPPNFQTIITITLKNTHTHTFTIIYIYYRYIVIYICQKSEVFKLYTCVGERERGCLRACVCVCISVLLGMKWLISTPYIREHHCELWRCLSLHLARWSLKIWFRKIPRFTAFPVNSAVLALADPAAAAAAAHAAAAAANPALAAGYPYYPG